LFGIFAIILPYFLSLEHDKLEKKYGKERGRRVGEIYGVISGWVFFIFWFGIWLSPQDRFLIPICQNFSFQIPFLDLAFNLVNISIFAPFFISGAFFGIKGVLQTTLKVAETHRPTKIVTTGVYSIVRHPQYLGGILAHIGFSFLLSATYSLLSTPLIITLIYVISMKEERELTKEFGQKYINYKKKTPMFFPTFQRNSSPIVNYIK
jgi:protein-S-isoprenylcysteine O-methyltransferase Ste14